MSVRPRVLFTHRGKPDDQPVRHVLAASEKCEPNFLKDGPKKAEHEVDAHRQKRKVIASEPPGRAILPESRCAK